MPTRTRNIGNYYKEKYGRLPMSTTEWMQAEDMYKNRNRPKRGGVLFIVVAPEGGFNKRKRP